MISIKPVCPLLLHRIAQQPSDPRFRILLVKRWNIIRPLWASISLKRLRMRYLLRPTLARAVFNTCLHRAHLHWRKNFPLTRSNQSRLMKKERCSINLRGHLRGKNTSHHLQTRVMLLTTPKRKISYPRCQEKFTMKILNRKCLVTLMKMKWAINCCNWVPNTQILKSRPHHL